MWRAGGGGCERQKESSLAEGARPPLAHGSTQQQCVERTMPLLALFFPFAYSRRLLAIPTSLDRPRVSPLRSQCMQAAARLLSVARVLRATRSFSPACPAAATSFGPSLDREGAFDTRAFRWFQASGDLCKRDGKAMMGAQNQNRLLPGVLRPPLRALQLRPDERGEKEVART